MTQTGKPLSMHGDAVYRGNYTHNGTLLNIHENCYTIGYSALLSPDGTSGGATAFGNAVFYDGSTKNNHVFAGAPTTVGAIPLFAGLIAREAGIASTYPVKNSEIQSFQNGLIVKQGYLIYKKADVFIAAGTLLKDVEIFDYVFPNWCMFARKVDGTIYFSPNSTVVETTGDIMVGRVVAHNPDDKSYTVYVSPAVLNDQTIATPTLTVTATAGAASISTNISMTTSGNVDVKLSEGTTEVEVKKANLVFNTATNTYVAVVDFNDLTAGTEYTVAVNAYYAGGTVAASKTATPTT